MKHQGWDGSGHLYVADPLFMVTCSALRCSHTTVPDPFRGERTDSSPETSDLSELQ